MLCFIIFLKWFCSVIFYYLGQAAIPYSRVHDPPKGFKDPQEVMLIPGCSISVKIIDVERHTTTHMIYPNL